MPKQEKKRMKIILLPLVLLLKTSKGTLLTGALFNIKNALFISLLISPIVYLWSKVGGWYMENEKYAMWVLVAIAVDHFVGTMKYLYFREFSMKKNIFGLLLKLGLVVAVGLLFEGLGEIITKQNGVKDYIIIVLRLIVFLYPFGSVMRNSHELTNGRFPPMGLMKKLNRFSENLDPSEFKKKKDEN